MKAVKPREYPPEFKRTLVDLVKNDQSVPSVARSAGIQPRLLHKWVKLAKDRPDLEPIRRGPKPLLPLEAEAHIHDYIIGHQRECRPVRRADILRKARQVSELVCDTSVGEGWYQRFLERHEDLVVRTAQALTKSGGSVVDIDITTLFNTLLGIMLLHRLDGRRIFNIDETSFKTTKNSKEVVALTGSKDIWNLDPATNFHLTIVACGSASGLAIPPTFILPGKTVKVDLLVGCDVDDAAVTTTPTGFMNMSLFSRWLRFFSDAIPADVKRPVLLVMDGCSSHYSIEIVEQALTLGILIILLPSNATHLLQPLDVAVFLTLKGILKNLLSELMEEDGDECYTIEKKTAIKLVGMAWMRSHIGSNISAGFRACGISPLSLVKTNDCLNRFKTNGTMEHPMQAAWLQVKEHIETQVLTLPPKKKQAKKRKTTEVGGRLLTLKLLEEAASVPLATPRKKNKAHTAIAASHSVPEEFEVVV